LQRKAKEDPATPYQGDLGQMNLLGMQSLPPASTAKLVLEVYNGNSLLSTQEQYVSTAGETAWEELSIGMTLPPNTTSVVAYMKYEGGTEVYFDDLKIELSAVPVAMVVQENQYYPFGLGMKGLDYVAPSPNVENKFTFNGQTEKETKLGLNWHETAFRRYDPQLGRFHQIDPLADLFTGITPFQFGYNNPVLFNDPTGLEAEEWKPRYIGSDPCKPCQEKKNQQRFFLEGTNNFGSLLAGVEKPNSTTSQYESYRNKKSYPGSAGPAGVPLSEGISPKTDAVGSKTVGDINRWVTTDVTNLTQIDLSTATPDQIADRFFHGIIWGTLQEQPITLSMLFTNLPNEVNIAQGPLQQMGIVLFTGRAVVANQYVINSITIATGPITTRSTLVLPNPNIGNITINNGGLQPTTLPTEGGRNTRARAYTIDYTIGINTTNPITFRLVGGEVFQRNQGGAGWGNQSLFRRFINTIHSRPALLTYPK
jgi:RHS repeat-associated protein